MRSRTTSRKHRAGETSLFFRVLDTPALSPDAADAPAIVLVHGIGMSHRYLWSLHRTLAAESRVLSIDLPGFAGLPKPGEDVDVVQMSAALGELLDSLIESPVVLVGHSMGAQWAIEAAVQRPDLVSAVVAIGPVADDKHRTPFAQARALTLDSLGESPVTNFIVFTDYIRCGLPWYLTQVRHMVGYPTEDQAGQLAVPLLVMRGAFDPIAGREWCRRLRDLASTGSFVEIPRGHHVVQRTAPRAVADAIQTHVRSWGIGSSPGTRPAEPGAAAR